MFVSAKLTAANAGALILDCPVHSKLVIAFASVYVDGGCSVNVAVNIGFGVNALSRVATGHPGIVPGSGFVEFRRAEGNPGEDIYVSTGAPTSGSVQFNLDVEIHPLAG